MPDFGAIRAEELADAIDRKDRALMHFAGLAADLKAEVEQQRPIVTAARALVEWHLRGQPGTPGTLYPFTYAQQEAWHDELDRCLSVLISAVAALDTSEGGSAT